MLILFSLGLGFKSQAPYNYIYLLKKLLHDLKGHHKFPGGKETAYFQAL